MVEIYSFCITVIGYIYVFGSSLLGQALLKIFIEDATFPSNLYSSTQKICKTKLEMASQTIVSFV